MATCINRSAAGYGILQNKFGSTANTDIIILGWQSANNSENFPTLQEATAFARSRNALEKQNKENFFDSLLESLSSNNTVFQYDGQFYINNQLDGKTVSPAQQVAQESMPSINQSIMDNVSKIKTYLEKNNLKPNMVGFEFVRNGLVKLKLNREALNEDLGQLKVESDSNNVKFIINHLSRVIPSLKIELVSAERAKKVYDALDESQKAEVDFNDVKSFYVSGTAYLIQERVDDLTAIEEILHPFVDAVKIDNEDLFNNLLEEAKATFPELAEQIAESYSDSKGFNQELRDIELVTQVLSKHFNQEVENPPRTFLAAIKEFLNWFRDIIANVVGRFSNDIKISASNLTANTSMSDIAKMLNVKGLTFEIKPTQIDNRVKYALSPRMQKVVDFISEGANSPQKARISELFHLAQSTENTIDSLTVGQAGKSGTGDLITFDDPTHSYYNVTQAKYYKSTTQSISKRMGKEEQEEIAINTAVGNDIDIILEGLASGTDQSEIRERMTVLESREFDDAYDMMEQALYTITHPNGVQAKVAIPQVVLHDVGSERAGMGDIILIDELGRMQVIDLKTSVTSIRDYSNTMIDISGSDLAKTGLIKGNKISKKLKHELQVNMYTRMLENMGYEISPDPPYTMHVRVNIVGQGKDQKYEGTVRDKAGNIIRKGLEYEGIVSHPVSAQGLYVDALIPLNVDVVKQKEMQEQLEEFDGTEANLESNLEEFESAEDPAVIAQEEYDTLFGLLSKYREQTIDKIQLIETLRGGIAVGKTKGEVIKEMSDALATINALLPIADLEQIRKLSSVILGDIVKEQRKFIEYIKDSANFSDPEYINYVMNMSKFTEFTRELLTLPRQGLNKTTRAYLDTLAKQAQELGGSEGKSDGLLDTAVIDAVKGLVKKWSSRPFTEEELDELMSRAEDISLLNYATMDIATAKDTLLALMDKIVKSKKQLILDRQEARTRKILVAANALYKLDPVKDRQKLYEFMLEFGNDGEFTGRIVKKIGNQYYDLLEQLRNETFEGAQPKRYIENPKNQAERDYNIDLARKKEALRNFWNAEKIVDNKEEAGDYHEYTQEFQTERAKFMYIRNNRWVRKRNVSDEAFMKFKAKYYESRKAEDQFDGYAIKKKGVFTGDIAQPTDFEFVKKKYTQIREESSKGENMRSKKYDAMLKDNSTLGKARMNFYEMYVDVFENELLAKLDPQYRDQMIGKVPLVRKFFARDLKKRGGLFTKIYSKLKGNVESLDKMFTNTIQQRQVNIDSKGNLVTNGLPVFYTGSIKREKDAQVILDKIEALKERRKNNEIKVDPYKEELARLKGELYDVQSGIAANEVNLDLGATLVAFSGMAENFEVMAETENTMNALLKVIGEREYTPAKDTFKKVVTGVRTKTGFEEKGEKSEDKLIVKRAKKYMKMVFYDNDNITKGFMDKAANALTSYASLSYVAFNPFGNFNNYVLGRINNGIEAAGQRFFSAQAYKRAEIEYNRRVLPAIMNRLGNAPKEAGEDITGKSAYNIDEPLSKYEALTLMFRMMDNKADIRESGRSQLTGQKGVLGWLGEMGYLLQDGAEWNVQTKIGMAMLMDTTIKNSKTNETLSLYDAFEYDTKEQNVRLKEGYDTIVEKSGKEVKYTDDWRYDMRNKIREVNKQVHGNYAYEDRMVLQSHWLGKLTVQFKKWVVPALNARFRSEYYDENLGWLEGRYISFFKFLAYAMREIKNGETSIKDLGKEFKEEMRNDNAANAEFENQRVNNKLYNVYRTLGEIGFIMSGIVLQSLLSAAFAGDDDDDLEPWLKRMKNYMLYQVDRTNKELVTFIPIPGLGGLEQAYQAVKNPIAATRTLGEFGEALSYTVRTPLGYMFSESKDEFYANSEYVYQRKPKKGELKLKKQWFDALPILYTIQKWNNFRQQQDFYIK